uniref:Uncharacterized protein n=1 Tax=Lactuca sativa TaxID=4236 RepID=A0A9R1WKB5_LACSA|nr:hypothetical protein LSAT_V11C100048830 [Lactuca sativa]
MLLGFKACLLESLDPSIRDDELTILDVRKFKPIHKCKFNYEASILLFVGLKLKWSEVNEIAWNMSGDMFFLTTLPSGAGNPSLAL